MKPCANAGRPCPREATLTARIAGVGDRALCQQCHDSLVSLGMSLRVLEPNAYKPQWLADRRFARDLTGRLA